MVIDHINADEWRAKLQEDPHFKIGPHTCGEECKGAWWNQPAILEVPLGELCKGEFRPLPYAA